MKLYAIHAPRDPAAPAEEARAERTGFSVAALLFGPLWLLARGAWGAALVYAGAAGVVAAAVAAKVLPPGAALVLFVVVQFFLAFEARALALAARERSGRPLIDLVFARDALEAEKVYLERLGPSGPRRGPAASGEVIGMFPEPGR